MTFTFRKVGGVNLNFMQIYSVSVEGYDDFLIQAGAGNYKTEVLLRIMNLHCINMVATKSDKSEDYEKLLMVMFSNRTKIKGILP